MKDLQRDLEDSRAAQKEVLGSARESERRSKAMEADIVQLHEVRPVAPPTLQLQNKSFLFPISYDINMSFILRNNLLKNHEKWQFSFMFLTFFIPPSPSSACLSFCLCVQMLAAAERARKQAETERDELSEELASNSSGK